MQICLITSRVPPENCGVGDYCRHLASALQAHGIEVSILTGENQQADSDGIVRNLLPNWGISGMFRLIAELKKAPPDLVIIQWVPFLYHRLGVNCWLPLALLYLRLCGINIETMVHEPWVPLDRWQYYITGPIQRLLLTMLIFASRRINVSISAWTELLQRIFPWRSRDINWMPVSSNIPIIPINPVEVARVRTQLGISELDRVIMLFSPFGSGKGYQLIEAGWQAAKQFDNVQLVVIGATATQVAKIMPSLADDQRVHFTGYLDAAAVSAHLQCADLFFAPFIDGMSTRRTSALSALEHGVPVITTRGSLYDRALFETSPLMICDYQPAEFARATTELLSDDLRRTRLKIATREFFQQHFAWPVIVDRLISHRSVVIADPVIENQVVR